MSDGDAFLSTPKTVYGFLVAKLLELVLNDYKYAIVSACYN